MAKIMAELKSRKDVAAANAAKSSPSSTSKDSSLKSHAPTLDPFSGNEEDFWQWFSDAYIAYGEVGWSDSLTDPEFHKKDPQILKAGFFAWEKAL